jgi:hypothetical protein
MGELPRKLVHYAAFPGYYELSWAEAGPVGTGLRLIPFKPGSYGTT